MEPSAAFHWTIRVIELLGVCFDKFPDRELCELLLREVVVKAKLTRYIGRGKHSRRIAMQEQQHLQPENGLDLLS